jgi:hypothetical protein
MEPIPETARTYGLLSLLLLHDIRVKLGGPIPGRGLDPDGVRGDELAPDWDGPEDHLQPVEEVLADNDDSLTACRPPLTRRYGLDLRHQGVRVQPCKISGK